MTKTAVSTLVDRCDEPFLQMLFEAGVEAGLSWDEVVRRGVPIAFEHTAVQLADDLCDGDRVLGVAEESAPVLLMLLHNEFLRGILEAGIDKATVLGALRNLDAAGAGQIREVHTMRWTLRRAMRAALATSGQQAAAYFRLLWYRTPLARHAGPVGRDLGFVLHITADVSTGDQRFWSLNLADRCALCTRAEAAAKRLRKQPVLSVRQLMAEPTKALRAAK